MNPQRTRLSAAAIVALAFASACIPDVVPDQFSLPGCDQVEPTCGPSADESCCAAEKVPGGDFDRINDTGQPAHVSSFTLDRFEVTVGRFRQFVAGYPQNRPKKDAGRHPLIADSGWKTAWDANLPGDQKTLKQAVACNPYFGTWTDTAGANEVLPMNCVSWYVAFAFCAWDGGRLPTGAEWNYAAAGGSGERVYPWGDTAPESVDVLHDCQTNLGTCIRRVGAASPQSDGVWHHADLAGSMVEWTLDYYGMLPLPCTDCALLIEAANGREVRGGDFNHGPSFLATNYRYGKPPETPEDTIGFRCARDD